MFIMKIDEVISARLLPNEICVVMFIGNEKLRYILAGAYSIHPTAIDTSNKIVFNLEDQLTSALDGMNVPLYNKRITY